MQMIKVISVKLDQPHRFTLKHSTSTQSTESYCRFKLESISDAKKFVDKFHGMKWKSERLKLNIQMIGINEIEEEKEEDLSQSRWLKIINLHPKVLYLDLSAHIIEQSGLKPKYIDISCHSQHGRPSFDFLQMESSDAANTVIEKAQMSSFRGFQNEKLWIQHCSPLNLESPPRNEHLRGQKVVILRNLSVNIKEKDIRSMCAHFAHQMHRDTAIRLTRTVDDDPVESIKFITDDEGYRTGGAKVVMTDHFGAAAIFDRCHGEKRKGSEITTHLESLYPNTNSLTIEWLHQKCSRVEVAKFIKQALEEYPDEPVQIEFVNRILGENEVSHDLESRAKAAKIIFSKPDLVTLCLRKLQHQDFQGRTVVIFESEPFEKMDKLLKSNWVMMYNLSPSLVELPLLQKIKKMTKKKVQPISFLLKHHSLDPGRKGFAVVQLSSQKQAKMMVDMMNLKAMHKPHGYRAAVSSSECWIHRIVPPEKVDRNEQLRGRTCNVMVSNIRYNTDHHGVMEICQKYGRVRKVFIPETKDGYPACRAMVTMWNEKKAERLFDGLHKKKVNSLKIQTSFCAAGLQREHAVERGKGIVFSRAELKGKIVRRPNKLNMKRRDKLRRKIYKRRERNTYGPSA